MTGYSRTEDGRLTAVLFQDLQVCMIPGLRVPLPCGHLKTSERLVQVIIEWLHDVEKRR